MAQVTMRTQISGTRNGAEWPAPGGSMEVSDDEAAALVAIEAAVLEVPGDHEGAQITAAVIDTTPAKRKG